MLRTLTVALILATVGLSSPRARSAPVGTGLLGATEAQITRKLGPPDAKAAERYRRTLLAQPMTPAVRTAFYRWKSARQSDWMVFGFDRDGIARNVQVVGLPLTMTQIMPQITSFRSAIAGGWTADRDTARVYPPVDKASPHVGNYIHWHPTTGPIQWGTRFSKVDGIDHEGVFRMVSASRNHECYAMCEVYFWNRSGNPFRPRSVVVADADAFWAWTLEELLQQWKEGPRQPDPKNPARPENRSYEEWLGVNFRIQYDKQVFVAQRLTAAVVAIVRNPHVDLKRGRVPAQLVAARYDQTLSKQLLTVFQSAPKNSPVRERAATILGLLDDPAAIEPLIGALRDARPSPAAAKALQELSGQDHGVNAEHWQKWWQANRKHVQQAHAVRQRERSGKLTVAHSEGSRMYHKPTPANGSLTSDVCPVLLKDSMRQGFRLVPLSKAREAGWRPCSRCRPPH